MYYCNAVRGILNNKYAFFFPAKCCSKNKKYPVLVVHTVKNQPSNLSPPNGYFLKFEKKKFYLSSLGTAERDPIPPLLNSLSVLSAPGKRCAEGAPVWVRSQARLCESINTQNEALPRSLLAGFDWQQQMLMAPTAHSLLWDQEERAAMLNQKSRYELEDSNWNRKNTEKQIERDRDGSSEDSGKCLGDGGNRYSFMH